jgi:hypothetical protein
MNIKEMKFPILIMCDRHAQADMLIEAIRQLLGHPREDLFHVRKLAKIEKWDTNIFATANSTIKVGSNNECQYIVDISY